MKKLLIILWCATALTSQAVNRPETIPSKLLEVKTSSWYHEKFRDWMTYLTANPTDKAGWIECFKAAQYGGMNQELSVLVNEIENRFPASAEAYWVKAKVAGWTPEGVTFLQNALANRSKNEEMPDRVMLAEYLGADRAEASQRLHESKLVYPSLLNYSYNVLMSVGENGYLFIEGDNTTIPIWLLQDVMGVRQDVRVLNLNLLENAEYRQRKLSAFGLSLSGADIAALPLENKQAEFYYALTLPSGRFELIEDQLYVVGLTSLLSDREIDNYALLKENIETKFLLDYLTVDFNGEPKTATGKTLETNYIIPFFLLREYYEKTQNKAEAEAWRQKIKEIAGRSQLAARVNMLLENAKAPTNFKKIEMSPKEIEKRITKVKDNIYAARMEITNREYAVFTKYLQTNGYQDLYEIAKIDLDKYEDPVNKRFHTMYHTPGAAAKGTYEDYPAMDITFEAAKLYCEWLTEQYNMQEGRAYKKVKFRLPSRKEWTMAALGYVEFQSWNFEDNTVKARPDADKPRVFQDYPLRDVNDLLYPWYTYDWDFRNRIQNEKGCYLANIKTTDDVKCEAGIPGDGFLLPSPVGTYFPNNMGLFDVVGNIAEMIDEKGKAMGGSWNHAAEECTIRSMHTFDKADPTVGFRIFMEVIEE